ncbi:MAG: site-2 protease family protein [Saprospiraceae bacterium]
MFKSFKIGQLFNIPIYLHWSFLLLPLIVIYRGGENEVINIVWEIGLVGSLFFCVLLHEYGHALSARRYGVETLDIILSVIGGVARLTRLPEKPWHEFVVAAAGPAVNIVIAVIVYLFLWITGSNFLPTSPIINGSSFLQFLAFANIMLVVFNLVPAFPMDGGRMLRAALNTKLSRVRATYIAMLVGQILAVLAAGYGLYFGHYTLVFIAVFVFVSAGAEYRGIKKEAFLTNHPIRDAMKQQFYIVQQSNNIDYAIQILTNSGQQHFPVLNLMELNGILTHQQILKALSDKNTFAPISEYMTSNFTVLSPDDSIRLAYQLFQENGYELIPIIENNVVIGILDKASLNEFLQMQAARS